MRRPCIEPGCTLLAQEGRSRCQAHQQQQARARNRGRRTRAHPSQGAAALLRRAVNQTGTGTCAHCHRAFTAAALEVDHRIPLADGGTDTPDNIQLLCRADHATKTADEQRTRIARRHTN